MKITKVSVNYGVTKNMGNYESLRLDYAITLDADNSTSLDRLRQGRIWLREQVEKATKEEIEYLHGAKPNMRR